MTAWTVGDRVIVTKRDNQHTVGTITKIMPQSVFLARTPEDRAICRDDFYKTLFRQSELAPYSPETWADILTLEAAYERKAAELNAIRTAIRDRLFGGGNDAE